jgi:uncharacterized damage-inducible protein DinB
MNYTLIRPSEIGATRRVRQRDVRRRTLRPLIQLLRQLGEVVDRLDDAQYVRKPVGVIESSVGGHVRHCLDHVRSLLTAIETGHLDYDHRERGTLVESSRDCAIEQIEAMAVALAWLPEGVLGRPLAVSVTMSSGDDPVEVESSVGRELAFVLSHTIHHNAIVNAMVRTLGGWVPERFGYAPSTVRHMERTAAACAR